MCYTSFGLRLIEEVTFHHRPEAAEGISHVNPGENYHMQKEWPIHRCRGSRRNREECYSGKVKGEIRGHAHSPFPIFIDLTITSRPRVFKP